MSAISYSTLACIIAIRACNIYMQIMAVDCSALLVIPILRCSRSCLGGLKRIWPEFCKMSGLGAGSGIVSVCRSAGWLRGHGYSDLLWRYSCRLGTLLFSGERWLVCSVVGSRVLIPLDCMGEVLRNDKLAVRLAPFHWKEYSTSPHYTISVELKMVSLYTIPWVLLKQVIYY